MNTYYYDLHIHSCLSPCADNDNTPHSLAGMALLAGLQIVALTDHNTTKNCPAFFEACKAYGLVPIAGMELTTAEDIHVVCLFEELKAAEEFSDYVLSTMPPIKNRPEIFGTQLIMDETDKVLGSQDILLTAASGISITRSSLKGSQCHTTPAAALRSSFAMHSS